MKIKRAVSSIGRGVVLAASAGTLAWGRVPDGPRAPVDRPPAVAAAPVVCLGRLATIVGTPGRDLITGTPGPDIIAGLGGDDIIYGGGGADVICGDAGNDFLDGQGGNDRVNGGAGNDVLVDQGGGLDTADYTDSPAAAVVRINNLGGTTSDGWGGTDSMDNLENADGTPFGDTIHGDNGANVITGQGGNDTLNGQGGNDTLKGDAGIDTAVGGPGVDACSAEILFTCP